MNLSDFQALFQGNIRAWLDWDALNCSTATITENIVTSRKDLGDIYTVWFVGPRGDPGDWRDPNHRPLRVDEASRALDSLTSDKKKRIQYLATQYAALNEPLVLLTPTYQAGQRMILLDVSHRIVAAYLAEISVRMLSLCIHGPQDAKVLPDLHWFLSQGNIA